MRFLSQTLPSQFQPSVLWLSVGSLAALQGAFTLSWVIYRTHLATLITQFNFPTELAPRLLLIESVLAIAIEPIAGVLSDRTQQQRGSRFPLIWFGVVAASALFVITPLLVSLTQPGGAWRWWLPVLLVIWGVAMSIFRTPALALLRRYASIKYLPLAASLLTLAAGLTGAAAPLGNQFILDLGTPLSFILGAIFLVGATVALKSVNSANDPASDIALPNEAAESAGAHQWSIAQVGIVFGIGLATTFVFRLAIETFPKILKAQLPNITPPLIIGTIFITFALIAPVAGILAVWIGNRRTMVVGLAAMAACMGLMVVPSSPFLAFLTALAIGASFSLVSNGTLPLALSLFPVQTAGLAIGAFFSGVMLAASLFGLFGDVLSQPSAISPLWTGLAALLLTGLCIGASESRLRM